MKTLNLYTFEGLNGTGKTTAIKDLVALTGWPVIKQEVKKDMFQTLDKHNILYNETKLWAEWLKIMKWRVETEYKDTFILDRGAFTHFVYCCAWFRYFNKKNVYQIYDQPDNYFNSFNINQTVIRFNKKYTERGYFPNEIDNTAEYIFNLSFEMCCRMYLKRILPEHKLFTITKIYDSYKEFKTKEGL